MTHIEAMKLALYALEDNFDVWTAKTKAITALRQAIEQAEQAQPYGWKVYGVSGLFVGEYAEQDAKAEAERIGGTCIAFPLYTAPPPRKPEHGDSARLDWLTNNPLEALDIFGHVKGADAVRWIRQDIDNRIKESA